MGITYTSPNGDQCTSTKSNHGAGKSSRRTSNVHPRRNPSDKTHEVDGGITFPNLELPIPDL
jgi:hypothetical protein